VEKVWCKFDDANTPYSEKIQYEKLLDLQICIFTDIVFLVLDFHSHKLES